jgi:tetratricopeptide (TPR) repeat protein
VNIFGTAWQGGILSKLKGFRLAVGYLPRLLVGDESLTHTQRDMAIAFILRYRILRRIVKLDYLLKESEAALKLAKTQTQESHAHEIALAHIRIAWIQIYSGDRPGAEANIRQIEALLTQITISGRLNQLASVQRHLGDMAFKLGNYQTASLYYSEALNIAKSVAGTDQIKKINHQLRKLRRVSFRRRAF